MLADLCVITAEINPNEPSAVATCNDLANFASHRVSSLARKERHTSRTRARVKIGANGLIGRGLDDWPSASRVADRG